MSLEKSEVKETGEDLKSKDQESLDDVSSSPDSSTHSGIKKETSVSESPKK